MSRGETQLHCSDSMPSGLTKMVITVGGQSTPRSCPWCPSGQVAHPSVRLSAPDQVAHRSSGVRPRSARRMCLHRLKTMGVTLHDDGHRSTRSRLARPAQHLLMHPMGCTYFLRPARPFFTCRNSCTLAGRIGTDAWRLVVLMTNLTVSQARASQNPGRAPGGSTTYENHGGGCRRHRWRCHRGRRCPGCSNARVFRHSARQGRPRPGHHGPVSRPAAFRWTLRRL